MHHSAEELPPLYSLSGISAYGGSGNWGETRKTATTVESFDRFSVQRSEGVDFK
jgi:hypothetical protein